MSYSLSGNLNNVPQSCVVLMAISDSVQITSLVFIWLCLKSDENENIKNIGAEVKYLCSAHVHLPTISSTIY